MSRRPRLFVCWFATAALALVALGVWQGRSYWEYSDGVYSLSARQVLHGQTPYRDFAAAQPPPVYYAGAAALWIEDSPASIRLAMALCEACVSLLVLLAVARLTRSAPAALLAALASFATPWVLREHAQLIPETLAAPLILGAALASSRRANATLAGVLGALAVACKLAFVIPAAAIVLTARAPRRALTGLAGAGSMLAVVFLVLFGAPLWTDLIHAQTQTGQAALHYVAGLWLQAGWNVLPLLIFAGLAWPRRAAIADRELARSLVGASVGSLLLLATLFKHGSYLTVLVILEPPLLCLAACGATLTLRASRERPSLGAATARLRAVTALGAAGLLITQVASLVSSPRKPGLFTRPFAASGPAEVLSGAQVAAATAAIRRCPPGAAYAGPPYLAFLADRRAPGSQPDQFIIQNAPVLRRFRLAAEADRAVCPNPLVGRGRAAP